MGSFENKFSPVSQDLIWFAEYTNGEIYSEFDFNTLKENSFYDINKDKLVRFGLVGLGTKMYYEVNNGIFKLSGQMIEVIYKTSDKEYYLTGQQKRYDDVITYKDAETTIDLSKNSGTAESNITQFNFGYKTNLDIDGINFNLKTICKISYTGGLYINFRLVSSKSLKGHIIIKRNGKIVDEIYAPLKKGKNGELNWLFK